MSPQVNDGAGRTCASSIYVFLHDYTNRMICCGCDALDLLRSNALRMRNVDFRPTIYSRASLVGAAVITLALILAEAAHARIVRKAPLGVAGAI
jgi:hypothetical protein